MVGGCCGTLMECEKWFGSCWTWNWSFIAHSLELLLLLILFDRNFGIQFWFPTLFCDEGTSQVGFGCVPTSTTTCSSGTILQENECVPDLDSICGEGTFISELQCLGLGIQAVGGTLLKINTFALFVSAIGVNPVITALVVATMVGVAAQVGWIVHKKKKN